MLTLGQPWPAKCPLERSWNCGGWRGKDTLGPWGGGVCLPELWAPDLCHGTTGQPSVGGCGVQRGDPELGPFWARIGAEVTPHCCCGLSPSFPWC